MINTLNSAEIARFKMVQALLQALPADLRFHSAVDLGRQLGLTVLTTSDPITVDIFVKGNLVSERKGPEAETFYYETLKFASENGCEHNATMVAVFAMSFIKDAASSTPCHEARVA